MKKGCVVFVIFTLWLSPAYAHKVNIFAWVEGDTVYTESKFSGGKPVLNGKVLVYDDKENLLQEGKIGEKGEYSFKIPGKTGLHIVLDATMGHANYWDIPLEEIKEALGDTPVPEKPVLNDQESTADRKEPIPQTALTEVKTVTQPAGMRTVTLSDIRKTVEQVLDTRLKPINRMLVESTDHKPNSNDILGGIGYILGLAGVGAYFHYRRRIKELDRT